MFVGRGQGQITRGGGVRDVPGDGVEQGVVLRSGAQHGVTPAGRLIDPGGQVAWRALAEVGQDNGAVGEDCAKVLAIQDAVHADLPSDCSWLYRSS